MKLRRAILLPVLAMCGCAQMAVNVNILDRNYWSSPEVLSNTISDQVANITRKRGSGEFTRTQVNIRNKAREALSRLAASGDVDPSDIERLVAPLDKFIDDGFNDADKHFAAAFQKLDISSKSSRTKRLTDLFSAQSELDAGNSSIRRVEDQVSSDLRTKIDGARKNAAKRPAASATELKSADKAVSEVKEALTSADKVVSEVKEALTGLIGNQGILNDPLASSVVYAPEAYWQRADPPHGINETFASGTFGNTDIAVKMESIGNFTIKGVRLDASKITQATFAVGRQAIKTVAAVNGIPMPTGTNTASTGTTALYPETPVNISSPDVRIAAADEAIIRRRLARLTVLETILIQRSVLIDPATDANATSARATAVKTVKDVFTANRGDLDTAPTTNK